MSIQRVDEKVGYVMREAYERYGKSLDYEEVRIIVAIIGSYLSDKEAK